MLNQLPTAGALVAPRSILQVGSTQIDWDWWECDHTGIYEAGTIEVSVPGDYSQWPWWTQQTEILVDVYVGFPPDPASYTAADLTLLQTYRIDSIHLDAKTLGLRLVGRDLAGLLTDTKVDVKFQNMTSSQIATALAKQAGLTPNVQPTKELVGRFFTLDHVHLNRQQSMWSILTYLAQHEGVQCFVLGRTLYFGKFSSALSNEPYLIQYTPPTAAVPFPQSNATDLEFEHDLTLANDVSVKVLSYHGMKNAVYTSVATSSKTQKRVESHAYMERYVQEYSFTFADLTQAQCDAKAQQLLEQISKHELKMSATLPGDAIVYPWTPIQVQGTGTPFDTTYEAAKIRRRFSTSPPKFETHVHGKTVTDAQTVTLT